MFCKIIKISLFFAALFIACKLYQFNQTPPLMPLAPDPWWGPGKPGEENTAILNFRLGVPKEDIDDLKSRLSLPLRSTPSLENSNFTYGVNSETLKVIVDYWKDEYDWPKREARINKLPQFVTQIEGLYIHFIRAKPLLKNKMKVIPILLLHGWPGSILEFDEIIPILTNPQEGLDFVFEVIAPSIPGYGFSQGSSKMGLGAPQTCQIYMKLMERLNITKYYVQGGDWGALIASTMTTYYPEKILGMHTNIVSLMSPGVNAKFYLGNFLPSGWVFPPEDEHFGYPFSKFFNYIMREMGYAHIQATKPDTVGTALNNSPVGLAAYIIEKFSSWTHKENHLKPDGGLLQKDFPISLDRLLDNISLYWFSRSITTSMRYYAENMPNLPTWRFDEIETHVPAGFSSFKQEIINFPENLASHKYKNIITYRRHEIGGHFAAMELPVELAGDVIEFVTLVEAQRKTKKDKTEL